MSRIIYNNYAFRKILVDVSLNEFKDKNRNPRQELPPNYLWRPTHGESMLEMADPLMEGIKRSRKRIIKRCSLNKNERHRKTR